MMSRPASRHRRRCRLSGQALVPVLIVVIILTALAVTIALAARQETASANAYLREVQAEYLEQGAAAYAAAELQQATNGGTTTPDLSPPPDTDANGWTQAGDGWFKLEIIDTTSRLNINTATGATLAKLPALQADPSLAAAVVDWRDSDDNATVVSGGSGAESDYYQSLPVPYPAKNAPFDTIDELLLVRGFTTALVYGPNPSTGTGSQTSYFGTDLTRAPRTRQATGGQGGSDQPAVDTSSSTTPLAELITTYSREANVASDGTPRVNVKTANQTALRDQLGLSNQLAQRLISFRGTDGANITSVADLLNVPGFTRQLMQQIGDKVTVTDGQYRDGVININTAPAEVLATIPGVDETVYNAVVQAREGGTTFGGLNDLFQLTALNRQQLQSLLAAVCTKSSVYLVRVKVRMQGSNRVYAAQALVELTAPSQQAGGTGGTSGSPGGSSGAASATDTSGTARIVQWREVPRYPGWSTWVAPPSYYNPTGGSVGTP